MYSESDLESAIEASVLGKDAAAAFCSHVAQSCSTYVVDEENFRLISRFNDIFVVIASALLLGAVGWISALFLGMVSAMVFGATFMNASSGLRGSAVAASWQNKLPPLDQPSVIKRAN